MRRDGEVLALGEDIAARGGDPREEGLLDLEDRASSPAVAGRERLIATETSRKCGVRPSGQRLARSASERRDGRERLPAGLRQRCARELAQRGGGGPLQMPWSKSCQGRRARRSA